MTPFENALSLLPPSLSAPVSLFGRSCRVNEIRLRRDLPLSLSVGAENFIVDREGRRTSPENAVTCASKDLELVLENACGGSLYRYAPSLKRGHVTTPAGVRVGLCGADPGDGSTVDLWGLNLRIPAYIRGVCGDLLRRYRHKGLVSTLIFAPPGGGKTTFVRDLALSLASGDKPLRTAAVDDLGELFPSPELCRGALVDVVTGFGKAEGISRAVRLLDPQVVVCDELGSPGDADAIREYASAGAVFIATAHAGSRDDLLKRPSVRGLVEEGYFPLIVGLRLSDRLAADLYEEGGAP